MKSRGSTSLAERWTGHPTSEWHARRRPWFPKKLGLSYLYVSKEGLALRRSARQPLHRLYEAIHGSRNRTLSQPKATLAPISHQPSACAVGCHATSGTCLNRPPRRVVNTLSVYSLRQVTDSSQPKTARFKGDEKYRLTSTRVDGRRLHQWTSCQYVQDLLGSSRQEGLEPVCDSIEPLDPAIKIFPQT